MPWTSSWGKNATWASPVFEATGRALFAAQEFEHRCRDLLRFLNLVEIYDSATDDPLDSLIARLPKDKLLGQNIVDLKRHREFNDEDTTEILKAAKDARNFIAHESARFNPVGRRRDVVERIEHELRPKLRDLAAGDQNSERCSSKSDTRELSPSPLLPTIVEAQELSALQVAEFSPGHLSPNATPFARHAGSSRQSGPNSRALGIRDTYEEHSELQDSSLPG